MGAPAGRVQNDDPRRLREMLDKVVGLAGDHQLRSVAVGIAGVEGDLLFPEVVNFVESALRVDDSIFRMTRSRAVCFIADASRAGAEEIMDRVLADFGERFPSARPPEVALSYFEIAPGMHDVSLKSVLPALFAPPAEVH